MDRLALERLDSFPYRHRLRDVMAAPLVVAESGMRLEAAAKVMVERKVSSLVVLDADGRASGILTERDVLRALARDGADAAAATVAAFMSSPVLEIREDAFVYRALGRMMRHAVRHLVAVEPVSRKAVGMVTGRVLLKLRVGDTLQLGDALGEARTAGQMSAVRAELPGLVSHMLAEGVDALDAAAVISQVYCDMTRRAAELAVSAMEEAGRGRPPAPWAMLVLGSGGRDESLLAPDQDNAIVHGGDDGDDAWFEELGRRTSDLLDGAGIPYCKGGIMASNAEWRRPLSRWEETVTRWMRVPEPQALLQVGIFFDFVPVCGDIKLAERLRALAVEHAAAHLFLNALAQQIADHHAPIGLFGRLRVKDGRVDLKLGGLFPIVWGARAMALAIGSRATTTAARLEAVRDAGILAADDLEALREAHQVIVRTILDQQVEDIAVGRPPGPSVDPKRLSRAALARLKEALRSLEVLPLMTRDVISGARGG